MLGSQNLFMINKDIVYVNRSEESEERKTTYKG